MSSKVTAKKSAKKSAGKSAGKSAAKKSAAKQSAAKQSAARTSSAGRPAAKASAAKKSSAKGGASQKSAGASLQRRLAGTWKLISAEDRDSPNEPWVPGTFGVPPRGLFIYDAAGNCSIQIMTVPPVELSAPDSGPTPAQALAIFNNYIAYFGTYTVDAQNIHHQVEGAWDPRQVGTDQVRPYELKGDRLIIGDQVTYIRVLERIG